MKKNNTSTGDLSDDLAELYMRNWPEYCNPRLLRLIGTLSSAYRMEAQRRYDVISRYRLSEAELDVLATLRCHPSPWELTPSEIQQRLLITSGGLSKILRQLEDRGFIERRTAEGDRRSKPIRLSASGKDYIERAISEVYPVMVRWMEDALTEKEVDQLCALLARLARPNR